LNYQKKYFYCVRESKPNILQSWMSNIHTYVYSVGEENRAIVEPEIQGSKILEQGLEHLMQEACFLSAQPSYRCLDREDRSVQAAPLKITKECQHFHVWELRFVRC